MYNIKHGIPSYYSPAQILAYLQKVNFPGVTAKELPCPNLANLGLLMRLHLLTFPYENTRLHYSPDHYMDVSPDAVFNRFVVDGKGGSWCYGQNSLLMGILRGLGYRVYGTPSRVNMAPPNSDFEDWTLIVHLVLVVQLDDEFISDDCAQSSASYMVDVGFGVNAPVRPIRLEHGHIVPGVASPEEHRVIRVAHPSSLHESESTRVWAAQIRCGSYQPEWKSLFIFYDHEYYPAEWIQSSQWLSRHPLDLFGKNVFVVQHFVVEEENKRPGDPSDEASWGRLVMLGTRVQRRIGDHSVTIKEFTTEKERVQILRDDFGITIEEEEISNMLSSGATL